MAKGYMGRILWVDLSAKTCTEESVPDSVYEAVTSGMGLAAWLLGTRMEPGTDPLGPGNILGFVSGLLTGAGSLFTGRWMLVGKSPLTGCWGDANCGGQLSPFIKKCGYDGIFFVGASDTPVVFVNKDGKPRIEDAGDLWGQDAVESEVRLKERYGKTVQVACIGPAGEKLSLISGVSNDRGRMAARAGLGAVMGAKKLKAIVLHGAQKVDVHDPAEMKRLTAACMEHVKKDMPLPPGPLAAYLGTLMGMLPVQMAQDGMMYKVMLKKWGTVSMNQISIEMGDSPIMNWKGSSQEFDKRRSRSVNPDAIIAREKKKYHCYSCPLGCGGICSGSGGYEETHKPEYETVLSLGGLLMNEDLDSIFYLNELLNRAGMDTISAGSTAAFALECFEHGLLTPKDTDGLELRWGNTSAIVKLLEKMTRREGIGDLLADGSKVAAEKIGNGAERFAMHAGGQDLPMHDGRLDPGFALHYAAEPAPGRHTIGAQLYYEMYQLWKVVPGLPKPSPLYGKGKKYAVDGEKAAMGAACSRYSAVFNGAGLCMFGAFMGATRLPLFPWINAATGWQRTPAQYLDVGGRIQALRQLFNFRHGVDPRRNRPNERSLGNPPMDHGALKGRSVDLESLQSEFWAAMGWDPATGRPLEEPSVE
ncbi:MAG: aldehyde ferredoxin oxidoreductase family protein [Deltaproteobacteria bacterium]|nr:aldehyde ferredoxin oxidoreductase family protein [Deltaproteobacteria bacterium]